MKGQDTEPINCKGESFREREREREREKARATGREKEKLLFLSDVFMC